MDETRFGTALDKIRSRRRFLFELIIIAISIALCINVFSSALLEVLQNYRTSCFWWTCLIISGLGLLIAVILAYFFAYMIKVQETSFIGITLAFIIDNEKGDVTFLPCEGYEPSKESNELYKRIHRETDPNFISGWPGPKRVASDAFGPGNMCWELITELLEAIVVILIREYGARSLTHSAMYHAEFRKFANKIPAQKLKSEKWPQRLSANRFLAGRDIRQIILPQWVYLETPSPSKKNLKPSERRICLKAEYGSLIFAISPYWTILRDRKRASERFNVNNVDQVVFLRMPIDVHQELCGGFMSRKMFYSDESEIALQYYWFLTLVNNAFRRMDWGRYLRGEGELKDND